MNNRIQFGEPIHPEIPEEELPPSFLLTGSTQKWKSASFRVYILQDVYAKIWAHVSKTPDIESGGVLVGHSFRTFDRQTTFVVVTAAIPQDSQDRSGGHFTVGPVQIAEARREMEQHYPGLIAVGWYHSHPGHGVFLSGQDMIIVSSIYDAPWHIAMVIDPIRRKEGIFVGPEGRQIGHRGDQQKGISWTGLRDEPDSVKAIALYNQVRDRLEEKRPDEARDILRQLRMLVERSAQLSCWRERGEYRNLTSFQARIDNDSSQHFSSSESSGNPQQEESYEIHSEPPWSKLPEPVRRKRGWSTSHWLTLSAVSVVGFAVLAPIMVFLNQQWPYWVTLIWGGVLSFLAVILAGYVIFSKEEIELSQSERLEMTMRPLHLAGERIIAFFLVGLVLILWVSYGVFSTKLITLIDTPISTESLTLTVSPPPTLTILPPSATATATATSIQTPTSTPTSNATDTLIPSPTPTNTLTPTYTPTWTPTVTSTITAPTLIATVIPIPTIVITSTDSITP